MIESFFSLQLFTLVVMTLSLVGMHVVRKYSVLVAGYVLQSVCLTVLLGIELYHHFTWSLLAITFVMFVIKVIIAPKAFSRLITQGHLNLIRAYLSVPLTLCVIFALFAFARSDALSPIATLLQVPVEIRTMLLGNMFMAIFLIINRTGALAQVLGVLSLENAIFTLGIFLHIKQLLSLELGILFNLLFWIIASVLFIKLLYQKFGSFDVRKLNQLKK